MSKKTIINAIISIIFAIFLTGCITKVPENTNVHQLTRVDVQVVKADESYEEAVMITGEKTIGVLRKTFQEIKWEPNVEPKMARKEDVKATLFFRYDENMPEKLVEYQIWFSKNDNTTTIISTNDNEYFGTLGRDDTQTLEKILLKK